MCVCAHEKKLPSRSCCTSERLKERQRAGLHTLSHSDRNSIDRKGNKKTGEFGGKTNQRDVKGGRVRERKREGDERKEQQEW